MNKRLQIVYSFIMIKTIKIINKKLKIDVEINVLSIQMH